MPHRTHSLGINPLLACFINTRVALFAEHGVRLSQMSRDNLFQLDVHALVSGTQHCIGSACVWTGHAEFVAHLAQPYTWPLAAV